MQMAVKDAFLARSRWTTETTAGATGGSVFPVQILPPKHGAESTEAPQSGWCIRVWQDASAANALEWVLFTTIAIGDVSDALIQVDWYATRSSN